MNVPTSLQRPSNVLGTPTVQRPPPICRQGRKDVPQDVAPLTRINCTGDELLALCAKLKAQGGAVTMLEAKSAGTWRATIREGKARQAGLAVGPCEAREAGTTHPRLRSLLGTPQEAGDVQRVKKKDRAPNFERPVVH